MCGIIGYVGTQQAAPFLLDGLKKLEYRGYDSAGIAVINKDKIDMIKSKGKLVVLDDKTNGGRKITGVLGIGHTRWATHGGPTDVNSHPHMSKSNAFAVVHNGIIENYMELKAFLQEEGYTFLSETDTEVVAHLLDYYYENDAVDALYKVMDKIEGAYALGVICINEPETLLAVRKDSPLIVGIGNGENYIASDIPAILARTRDVYLLDEKEVAVITKTGIKILDENKKPKKKAVFSVNWDVAAAEKGGYDHFMLKEIMEQPKATRGTILPRISGDKIIMSEIDITEEEIKNYKKIFIIACGSAYHVGIVAKYVFEDLARISVEVDLASEFRYRNPVVNKNDLVIIISQSGETLDTLAALRNAKKNGAKILSIVNVKGSSIARESDNIFYTHAGPEIAVATTKAYSTQMDSMFMMAVHFAHVRGNIDDKRMKEYIEEFKKLPESIQKILDKKEELKPLAKKFSKLDDVFFLGRGLDYAVAMEGSLKLKEISYIHSEAYAAGELKHGTISLVEDGTLIVVLATQEHLFEKMLSNIKEVKARGAVVIAIAQEGHTAIEKEADHVIYIPRADNLLVGALGVIPLQLFAYYVSVYKGCDVDKPRNLAKSVTVE